jgi:rSAM/selenodomain-associated transferase 1
MVSQKLVDMVKAPREGTVKTRLARSLGPASACQAYRELVDCLMSSLAGLSTVELRYTPDDAVNEMAPWLAKGWSALPQGEGDLGRRLHSAVLQSFADGPARLVIVGSDCPWVTPEDIYEAWNELTDHDLVLGPARDGGYWLIGLNQPQPALFDDITWSSKLVFQQTVDRARGLGLKVHCLRALSDVDEEADWKVFKKSFQK